MGRRKNDIRSILSRLRKKNGVSVPLSSHDDELIQDSSFQNDDDAPDCRQTKSFVCESFSHLQQQAKDNLSSVGLADKMQMQWKYIDPVLFPAEGESGPFLFRDDIADEDDTKEGQMKLLSGLPNSDDMNPVILSERPDDQVGLLQDWTENETERHLGFDFEWILDEGEIVSPNASFWVPAEDDILTGVEEEDLSYELDGPAFFETSAAAMQFDREAEDYLFEEGEIQLNEDEDREDVSELEDPAHAEDNRVFVRVESRDGFKEISLNKPRRKTKKKKRQQSISSLVRAGEFRSDLSTVTELPSEEERTLSTCPSSLRSSSNVMSRKSPREYDWDSPFSSSLLLVGKIEREI